MPPPRKLSPRRKSRRSRSRSYSPKQSHRRRSRSRSPKRRSRSPHKKHGKSKRSHSRSPHRKSPSPHYPVKRPADSSGKRSSHRSHSRSRTPPKKSRDDRYHKESSPKYSMSKKPRSPSPRRRSPSPQPRRHSPVQQTRRRSTSPQTRRHSPSPRQSASSSYSNTYPKKEQLFAVGKKHKEIDLVKIVDQGPKERLDKRFQTLEQLAQGAFDFEENITIGIHRGPHHMELDEDVPVSYDFNPKTFIMLFPKKDSSRPIFDRDEIKAFHHDDVLDEEAYVEKRTITVKPSEKQRPKWMDDYKITVGQDRSNYEDRRMVQDSRSRRHRSRSRSPGYSHQEVKVRLDPKPDPRYERIYRDQQRQEESILSYDSAPRTPHDLRYSLNKRKSDDIGPPRDRDRDDRGRDMDRGSKFDARSRIQARRQDSFSGDRMSDRRDQRDRDTRDSRDQRISRDSPGRSFGDKRRYSDVKTALPDFKNRPGPVLSKPIVWILGTSIIEDLESYTKEDGPIEKKSSKNDKDKPQKEKDNHITAESTEGESKSAEDDKEKTRPKQKISFLKDCVSSIEYHSDPDLKITDVSRTVKSLLEKHTAPQVIVLQCGENDILGWQKNSKEVQPEIEKDMKSVQEMIPGVRIVWSQMFHPWMLTHSQKMGLEMAKSRKKLNQFMLSCMCSENVNGCFIYHHLFRMNMKNAYFSDRGDARLHLTQYGMKLYITQLDIALKYFIAGKGSIFPYLQWPPRHMSEIPVENMCMFNLLQLRDFSESHISELSVDQIQQLSIEQINNIRPCLFSNHFIKALSVEQIKQFKQHHIMSMDFHQLNFFLELNSKHLEKNMIKCALDQKKNLINRGKDRIKSIDGAKKGQFYSNFRMIGYRGRGRGRGRMLSKRQYAMKRAMELFRKSDFDIQKRFQEWKHERRDKKRESLRERHESDERDKKHKTSQKLKAPREMEQKRKKSKKETKDIIEKSSSENEWEIDSPKRERKTDNKKETDDSLSFLDSVNDEDKAKFYEMWGDDEKMMTKFLTQEVKESEESKGNKSNEFDETSESDESFSPWYISSSGSDSDSSFHSRRRHRYSRSRSSSRESRRRRRWSHRDSSWSPPRYRSPRKYTPPHLIENRDTMFPPNQGPEHTRSYSEPQVFLQHPPSTSEPYLAPNFPPPGFTSLPSQPTLPPQQSFIFMPSGPPPQFITQEPPPIYTQGQNTLPPPPFISGQALPIPSEQICPPQFFHPPPPGSTVYVDEMGRPIPRPPEQVPHMGPQTNPSFPIPQGQGPPEIGPPNTFDPSHEERRPPGQYLRSLTQATAEPQLKQKQKGRAKKEKNQNKLYNIHNKEQKDAPKKPTDPLMSPGFNPSPKLVLKSDIDKSKDQKNLDGSENLGICRQGSQNQDDTQQDSNKNNKSQQSSGNQLNIPAMGLRGRGEAGNRRFFPRMRHPGPGGFRGRGPFIPGPRGPPGGGHGPRFMNQMPRMDVRGRGPMLRFRGRGPPNF